MSGERHDDMGAHLSDSRGDEFSGPTAVGGAQHRHAESRDAAHVEKVHAAEQVDLLFERHVAKDGLDAALNLS
jgi:hypothetical protein